MMALTMLNVPGGNESDAPTDPALLASIKAQGFDQVRIDIQDLDPARGRTRAEEVLAAGLQPLCIINNGAQLRDMPPGVLFDFGNEPDLNKDGRWPSWHRYYMACGEAVQIASLIHRYTPGQIGRLYVGSISNLDRDSLRYLRRLPIAE